MRDYFSHTIPGYGKVWDKLSAVGYCYKLARREHRLEQLPGRHRDRRDPPAVHGLRRPPREHPRQGLGSHRRRRLQGPDRQEDVDRPVRRQVRDGRRPKPTAKPTPKPTPKPTRRPPLAADAPTDPARRPRGRPRADAAQDDAETDADHPSRRPRSDVAPDATAPLDERTSSPRRPPEPEPATTTARPTRPIAEPGPR